MHIRMKYFFIRFVRNSYVLQYNIIRTRHPRVMIYHVYLYSIICTYIYNTIFRIIIDRPAYYYLIHRGCTHNISGWWRNSDRLARYVVYSEAYIVVYEYYTGIRKYDIVKYPKTDVEIVRSDEI